MHITHRIIKHLFRFARLIVSNLSYSWTIACITCLFIFIARPIEVRLNDLIFSFFVFSIAYLFESWCRRFLHLHIRGHQIEFLHLYRFVNFLLRVVFTITTTCIFLYIWKIDLIKIFQTLFGNKEFDIMVTFIALVIALRGSFLLSDLISRIWLNRVRDHTSANRLKTLIKLINGIIKTILVIFFLFMIMTIFNINTGPLFTNFWVVTAGMSLSLQSVIRDWVVGIITMFEDTVRVGDEVDISGMTGKVEEITLRAVKVRDNKGALITIPFGSINIVTNKTRHHIFVLFEILVDLKTNPEKVVSLMMKAGEELKKSTKLKGTVFMSDLMITGPLSVSSSGMLFEAKIKVAPCRPKPLQGVYYAICKNLFLKNKIKFGNLYEYEYLKSLK